MTVEAEIIVIVGLPVCEEDLTDDVEAPPVSRSRPIGDAR